MNEKEIEYSHVNELVDFVKIDKNFISCHFKCKVKDKTVVSTLAFEPCGGPVKISFFEMICI